MKNSFRNHCSAVTLLTAASFLFFIDEADACACCADPGEYSLTLNQPISDHQRGMFDGIKFASAAQLYLTDAGEEVVKGLSSASQENKVSAAFDSKRWRLTFRTEDGQTGVLTLPVPSKVTKLAADIHDSEAGEEPRLYKEMRLEGVATKRNIPDRFRCASSLHADLPRPRQQV